MDRAKVGRSAQQLPRRSNRRADGSAGGHVSGGGEDEGPPFRRRWRQRTRFAADFQGKAILSTIEAEMNRVGEIGIGTLEHGRPESPARLPVGPQLHRFPARVGAVVCLRESNAHDEILRDVAAPRSRC